MPKEIELKLSLPTTRIKHLQHLQLLNDLSISKPIKQKLYNIYYDTPDLGLKNQNCALRLRRIGKQWIQTIKTEGNVSSGLHERYEWEVPVTKNQLDFTQLTEPGLKKLFGDTDLCEQLRPIFITEFTRHTRVLQMSDGSQIEFCLDQGKVVIDHKKEPFSEIELELKSGEPAQLFRLALTLIQLIPSSARLENISKAERGYKLYTGYRTPPIKTLPIAITVGMHPSAAFILIARNCLDQLTRNEHGALAGDNTEYLYQMYVALCRLHSAFDFFAAAVSIEPPIIRELKWLTRQLQAACKWELFVMEQLSRIQNIFENHTGILTIIKGCVKLRKKYNKQARNSIKSKRYSELILRLNLWLNAIPHNFISQSLGLESSAKTILGEFAKALLANRHQQILESCKSDGEFDAALHHALYIKIKNQRYVAEFFRTLYLSEEEAKIYVCSLAGLQDVLETININTKIQNLLEEIPAAKTKSCLTREAMGIILGWNSKQLQQKRKKLQHMLFLLHDVPHFWKV